MRPHAFPRFDAAARFHELRDLSSHVAGARYAGCNQESQGTFVAADVNVHVPKSGHEIEASTIDYLRLFGYAGSLGGSDRLNSPSRDHDRHVTFQ
jgi:hypothetical protein